MDKQMLYNRFINLCRTTQPRERLINRNPQDCRLLAEYLYTESHHIIPKSMGGRDDAANLITLLPEEHMFIHKLRYVLFKTREDMTAVRFMINGFNHNRFKQAKILQAIPKAIFKSYIFIKQNSAEFRKNIGWQSRAGRDKISKARKNKMPMKDAITGESVGSVPRDHPNYLSGVWVHHGKGKVAVTDENGVNMFITTGEYRDNKSKYVVRRADSTGKNNPRYVDISDEEIFQEYVKFSKDLGFIVSINYFFKIAREDNNNYKPIPTRYNKQDIYKRIQEELDLPFLIKKSYDKIEKEKYFDGLAPKEYLSKRFNVDMNSKYINYPKTHTGKSIDKN